MRLNLQADFQLPHSNAKSTITSRSLMATSVLLYVQDRKFWSHPPRLLLPLENTVYWHSSLSYLLRKLVCCSNKNLMDLPSKPQPFSKESAKWSQLCSPDVFSVMVQNLADVRNNQKIVLSECLASESMSFVQGIIPLWLSWVVPGLVRTLTISWTQRPKRNHSRWEPWLARGDVKLKLLEAGALVAQGQSRRVEPRWGHQPHPQLCWHQTGMHSKGTCSLCPWAQDT